MKAVLQRLPRVATGILFAYAGWTKIPDAAAFATNIAAYKILPPALHLFAASTLPWVEVAAGAALATGVAVPGAALLLALLDAAFLAALASLRLRGIDGDCGCFGGLHTSIGTAIGRDLLLLAVLLCILAAALKPHAPSEVQA